MSDKLNRQVRKNLGGFWHEWNNYGSVTFEQAAKLAAGRSFGSIVVQVRCESNPDDVREFTVRRKPDCRSHYRGI